MFAQDDITRKLRQIQQKKSKMFQDGTYKKNNFASEKTFVGTEKSFVGTEKSVQGSFFKQAQSINKYKKPVSFVFEVDDKQQIPHKQQIPRKLIPEKNKHQQTIDKVHQYAKQMREYAKNRQTQKPAFESIKQQQLDIEQQKPPIIIRQQLRNPPLIVQEIVVKPQKSWFSAMKEKTLSFLQPNNKQSAKTINESHQKQAKQKPKYLATEQFKRFTGIPVKEQTVRRQSYEQFAKPMRQQMEANRKLQQNYRQQRNKTEAIRQSQRINAQSSYAEFKRKQQKKYDKLSINQQKLQKQLDNAKQQIRFLSRSQKQQRQMKYKDFQIQSQFNLIQKPADKQRNAAIKQNKKRAFDFEKFIPIATDVKKIQEPLFDFAKYAPVVADTQQIQQQLNTSDQPIKTIKQMGNRLLTINQKQSMVFIGISVKNQDIFFTKNMVYLKKQLLPLIPLYFKQLLRTQVKQNQKLQIPIKGAKLYVGKDLYKGNVFYTVRMFEYYDKQITPTRCGFNLTQQQMAQLAKYISSM